MEFSLDGRSWRRAEGVAGSFGISQKWKEEMFGKGDGAKKGSRKNRDLDAGGKISNQEMGKQKSKNKTMHVEEIIGGV